MKQLLGYLKHKSSVSVFRAALEAEVCLQVSDPGCPPKELQDHMLIVLPVPISREVNLVPRGSGEQVELPVDLWRPESSARSVRFRNSFLCIWS